MMAPVLGIRLLLSPPAISAPRILALAELAEECAFTDPNRGNTEVPS
jgi:hypothetical protein